MGEKTDRKLAIPRINRGNAVIVMLFGLKAGQRDQFARQIHRLRTAFAERMGLFGEEAFPHTTDAHQTFHRFQHLRLMSKNPLVHEGVGNGFMRPGHLAIPCAWA
ncbi:hypothetical protein D1872_260270 [compost metagenome]